MRKHKINSNNKINQNKIIMREINIISIIFYCYNFGGISNYIA